MQPGQLWYQWPVAGKLKTTASWRRPKLALSQPAWRSLKRGKSVMKRNYEEKLWRYHLRRPLSIAGHHVNINEEEIWAMRKLMKAWRRRNSKNLEDTGTFR